MQRPVPPVRTAGRPAAGRFGAVRLAVTVLAAALVGAGWASGTASSPAGAGSPAQSPPPAVATTAPVQVPPAPAAAAATPAGALRSAGLPAGVVLPDPALTPGETFVGVTTGDVCTPGWASAHRDVTYDERLAAFAEYGITYSDHRSYELDHLVPLELGGDNSLRNLWPEPADSLDRYGYQVKDALENRLHNLVCSGELALGVAQHAIARNWYAVMLRYGSEPGVISSLPAVGGTATGGGTTSGGGLACSASMSDATPAQYTTTDVLVRTSPAAGVDAVAHYRSKDTEHSGTATGSGLADIPFYISGATVGYTVQVDVTVTLSGRSADCSTWFTPQ